MGSATQRANVASGWLLKNTSPAVVPPNVDWKQDPPASSASASQQKATVQQPVVERNNSGNNYLPPPLEAADDEQTPRGSLQSRACGQYQQQSSHFREYAPVSEKRGGDEATSKVKFVTVSPQMKLKIVGLAFSMRFGSTICSWAVCIRILKNSASSIRRFVWQVS